MQEPVRRAAAVGACPYRLRMRILTLRQPWASLVAIPDDLDGKRVENRRWPTSYRGELAIHAGKEWDPAADRDPVAIEAMTAHGLTRDSLPTGVVVALARLQDSHQSEGLCCVPWGRPDDGTFHLLLEQVRPLREPVAITGQLGMRELHAEERDAVRAGL